MLFVGRITAMFSSYCCVDQMLKMSLGFLLGFAEHKVLGKFIFMFSSVMNSGIAEWLLQTSSSAAAAIAANIAHVAASKALHEMRSEIQMKKY